MVNFITVDQINSHGGNIGNWLVELARGEESYSLTDYEHITVEALYGDQWFGVFRVGDTTYRVDYTAGSFGSDFFKSIKVVEPKQQTVWMYE